MTDRGNHITTQIEHPAMPNTCRYLEDRGCAVTYLAVDEFDLADPQSG